MKHTVRLIVDYVVDDHEHSKHNDAQKALYTAVKDLRRMGASRGTFPSRITASGSDDRGPLLYSVESYSYTAERQPADYCELVLPVDKCAVDDHARFTWRDLRDFLIFNATEIQLNQPVQTSPPGSSDEEAEALASGVTVGTVRAMYHNDDTEEGITFTRSPYDNKHHPDHLVLITDANLLGEDGSIAEDLMTGEKIWPGGESETERYPGTETPRAKADNEFWEIWSLSEFDEEDLRMIRCLMDEMLPEQLQRAVEKIKKGDDDAADP